MRPIRILQVVYQMGLGGIETWLMDVLRNIDRRRFVIDFLVYTSESRFHDLEIQSLGSRIIPCTHPSKAIKHTLELKNILINQGPYDVIHAHGTHSVARTLKVGASVGIPIRIAQSHNDFTTMKLGLRNRLFRPLLARWLKKYMTVGIGVSEEACLALFGDNWESDPRCQILYYGIDWQRYQNPESKSAIRQELSLPQNSLIVGNVGRFVPQKNHAFLVDIAQDVSKLRDDARFLLIGDGRLMPSIEQKVKNLGLENHFIFMGERPDVVRLLQAMDVFLFPSIHEGLGIALLEAQAVGLPCVISETIPIEASVVKEQVFSLPLNTPVGCWTSVILDAAKQNREHNHPHAWETIASSRFSLQHNIDALSNIYKGKTG